MSESRSAVSDDSGLDEFAEAAAVGYADAFDEIHRLLVDDVRSFVRAHCWDDDVCEDLVAKVFLKAKRDPQSPESTNESCRSWIFAIAASEVRNYRLSVDRPDYWKTEEDIGQQRPTGQQIDRRVTKPGPCDALAALTNDQREVVTLRLLGRLSVAEISLILEKNEAKVRALQFMALSRLKPVQ